MVEVKFGLSHMARATSLIWPCCGNGDVLEWCSKPCPTASVAAGDIAFLAENIRGMPQPHTQSAHQDATTEGQICGSFLSMQGVSPQWGHLSERKRSNEDGLSTGRAEAASACDCVDVTDVL